MDETPEPPPPEVPFQAIIEQSLAGIYVMQDERFVYSNATWAGIVGYSPQELVGMHLRDLVAPDFLDTVLERYYQRLSGEVHSMRFVTRGVHRDGRIVPIEIHGSRMMFRGRPAVGGVGIDITERVAREDELRRSREQLQELTAYTHRKLEDQRIGIARDVHDRLGGSLTAMKMDATRILRRVQGDEVRGLTQGLIALTQDTIESVKTISESLRPSVLDHVGLAVAMARELELFSARAGVLHVLGGEGDSMRLSPKRAMAVYRIFQEGLTNVARHARATRVEVHLSEEGGYFVLRLHDDGRGFTPSMLDRGSLGLLSMTERAREAGGQLDIASAPGQGTQLVLRVPLL
ncbi:PAS domain S-box protein [Variovorax sp. KK3]|uniref:sensor histidine kinase n=1 Tax=Variovorax sp. KK3 TaxID=1855728 RepID=UPI00097BE4D3|nr:PAS domain S-box protein [Variovorax sp. KK3]